MSTRLRARWVWLGSRLRSWLELEVSPEGVILSLRELDPGASVDHSLLLPGLINAHVHMELSDQRGRVPPCPPGEPMHRWVARSLALRTDSRPSAIEEASAEMVAHGVRGCIDVHNGPDISDILESQGLEGTSLLELIGWDDQRWREDLDKIPAPQSESSFTHRVTAHAPISCSPALLQHALRPEGPPTTIHCEEVQEDRALLEDGTGPWAQFLDQLGRPWRAHWMSAPSGVALLDELELLRPGVGLVHLVFARTQDLDRVAARGAHIILCPRSNLHISGRLPDVPSMVERQIPLAIGTDSLASTPDLDLLAEASTLAAHFPEVCPEVWLRALTEGGAALLPKRGLGRLEPGSRPGVLSVDLPDDADPIRRLLDGSPWKRYWAA